MCGISGIVSQQAHQPECLVRSLEAIKHRGPDDSRVFSFENGFSTVSFSIPTGKARFPRFSQPSSAMFGFNRLSIVDLSDKGMQPFLDDKSQTLFMMNGEIYNYQELRRTYLGNETFISDSDSEVAFKLYTKLGDGFVNLLRGMFAIVIYSNIDKTLKAWRDPMGIKPFYYAITNKAIVFSSEMKGIFATGLVNKSLDPQGLAYSMYLGTCPSPITIYKDIRSLRPGHKLTYQKETGQLLTVSYWQLDYQPQHQRLTFEEFADDVASICRLYQTGEVPKGLMLSGGLDSGTLAYFMGQAEKSTQCFNLFTQNHSTDESPYAKLNAENAGLNFTAIEIPSTPNLELIARHLQSEEEPNGGPEATLYLCDYVHQQGIKVLFNALGPDEVFGGYRYYALINQYGTSKLFNHFPLAWFPKKWQSKMADVKQYGWGAFPLINRQFFSWQSIVYHLSELGYDAPQHPIGYLLDQIQKQTSEFRQMPLLKQASFFDIQYYIASHHSFRSDQPSMLNSIEMRFPFLDHLFVQKYFNQSWIFEGIDKQLKPAFRNYSKHILPSQVIEMPKKGFTMPTEHWLPHVELHPNVLFSGTNEKLWYGAVLHGLEKNNN
jgi:asparagine synthase (glutamine-hydrolysing)